VRNGVAVHEDLGHVSRPILDSLLHARRNFIGLAIAPANTAATIAYDDHRSKAESTAAFDDCCAPLDFDDLVNQLAASRFTTISIFSHADLLP
jgi:hypothetical protein